MTWSPQVKCLKKVVFNTGILLSPGTVYDCRERQVSTNGKTVRVLELLIEKEPLVIALDGQGRWQNDELFRECFCFV